MNINNKIKSFSIFIAAAAVTCSVSFPKLSAMEDNSNNYIDIINELESSNELDKKYEEINKSIVPEEKYNFYKNYCDGVQPLTTEIENKKKQLLESIGAIKEAAALCNEELEKIYNSKGFGVQERLEMFDEFLTGEIYRGYEESIAVCEGLKLGIDGDIKKYNEEQEAKKQAEIKSNQEKSANSQDNKNSSDNSSRQNYSGGSSKSSGYSGSSYSGSSSGGSGSSGGGSSSGGSSSSGGGSSSSVSSSSGGGSSSSVSSSSGGGSSSNESSGRIGSVR